MTEAKKPQVAIGVLVDVAGDAVKHGPNGGLVLTKVEKFSSAAKAGLAVGDEIVSIDGQVVRSPDEALAAVQRAGVGATVTVQAMRGGAALALPMKIFEKKADLDLGDISDTLERKISPAA
jgi:S1-C subfamily serine protease